jgi:tetratricopeptide (TPR) repeat protein
MNSGWRTNRRSTVLARTLIAVLTLAATGWAQTPPPKPQQQRDLMIEKEPGRPPAAKLPDAPAVGIPRSYALVVGISQYKNLDNRLQLRYAERDAESIYSILISPEGGNFKAENVHKLIGARATLANLRKELEDWLPSVAKPDDRVLIYFAGHGFIFQNTGYLAPYDFELSGAGKTGYPMDSLGRVIGSKIQAKWKVLLTDSCHSGAITPETQPELLNRQLLSLDRSLFSLTASRDRERSFESPDWGGGHGIFTYYVVKGMEGWADESGDGIVTADELAEYVRRNVREATKGEQNPTSDRGSFDPQMLLAFNPSTVKPGEPPAPKFGTLVFESNMDGVELYVDNNAAGVLKKGEPFRLPGLPPGAHTIKAVKMGYEPDGPREEMVYPGQESTVKINILILRRRNKSAVDAFDKGLESYSKGFLQNYRKAEEQFRRALQVDPQYSAAALYLGRTLNALYEQEKAEAAFRQAIEIDPDYLEARASYGGMLLDIGNVDESIRQLNFIVQRDPNHTQALYLLAQAYRMKEVYAESIDAAKKVIRATPNNPEAHFWLAESLRMNKQYQQSKVEYDQYLRLSNFDSKLAGKLNYYVVGYLVGLGKKKRASQQDIWRDLRSLAYFGLCDSERKLQNYDAAIEYCRRSLAYDPNDPYVHYALGLIYARKAEASGSLEMLAAAEKNFRTMLALNQDMSEAESVRKMLDQFSAELARR